DLQPERVGDVVSDQLEVGLLEQVGDVELLAGEEVVDADDVVAFVDEAGAEVRANEAGAAGDEDPLGAAGHKESTDLSGNGSWGRMPRSRPLAIGEPALYLDMFVHDRGNGKSPRPL